MWVMTESHGIINLDEFCNVTIQEQVPGDIDSHSIIAIGNSGVEDCPIAEGYHREIAKFIVEDLYNAIANEDIVWDARKVLNPTTRDEVALCLSSCIQDQETMQSVSLIGAKLVGTPLQVGMIFESIKDLWGQPDIASSKQNVEILRHCQSKLKYARECPPNPDGSGYYIDGNSSE